MSEKYYSYKNENYIIEMLHFYSLTQRFIIDRKYPTYIFMNSNHSIRYLNLLFIYLEHIPSCLPKKSTSPEQNRARLEIKISVMRGFNWKKIVCKCCETIQLFNISLNLDINPILLISQSRTE